MDRIRSGTATIAPQLALVLLAAALLAAPRARAQSTMDQPRPFAGFAGVPSDWTEVLNGYVYDPAVNGSRLIAIEREAGGNLPPIFEMAAADALWRSGKRRAAEHIFEQSLTAGLGYPWDDFSNLGMGMLRMTSGDDAGAEIYFGRLIDANEPSSQVLGNLGLGSTLASSGRFAEAQAAFEEAASTSTEPKFQQAARFGSATALYGTGDYVAAARAFDELAKSDPSGPIGRDARFAAARARIAAGDRAGSKAALRELVETCDPNSTTRRAPRALRNLDPRAIGRNWVRNYQHTGWSHLEEKGASLYSIGGCSLARSTLRAIERNDAQLTAVQPVAAASASAVAAAAPVASAAPASRASERHEAAAPAHPGAYWLLAVLAASAVAALAALWQLRARTGTR